MITDYNKNIPRIYFDNCRFFPSRSLSVPSRDKAFLFVGQKGIKNPLSHPRWPLAQFHPTQRKYLTRLKQLSEAFWIASDNSFHAFPLPTIPWYFHCLSATWMERRNALAPLPCVLKPIRTPRFIEDFRSLPNFGSLNCTRTNHSLTESVALNYSRCRISAGMWDASKVLTM